MILRAPAKVNLYLRVLGKRKDSYHNIETVFERIALFDRIVLSAAGKNKTKIFCDTPGVPVDRKSLIYKTIDAFRKRFKIAEGVEVKIFKGIPVAAGLGGGSSDAASVLMGLNKLWKMCLDLSALFRLGGEMGADIPFFLGGSSFAAATGKGDRIFPLNWKKKFWHLIVTPPIKLLSKDIYKEQNGQGRAGGRNAGFLRNDLEGAVLKKAPLVKKLKNALTDIGINNSLVSGSGPSIFSVFEKRKEAIRAKESLIKRFPIARAKGWQTFIVPTL